MKEIDDMTPEERADVVSRLHEFLASEFNIDANITALQFKPQGIYSSPCDPPCGDNEECIRHMRADGSVIWMCFPL